MRDLKFKDAFTVSRILKKMHIRPEVKDDVSKEQYGADLVISFFDSIGDAEEEVTAFIADLKGIKPSELAEMNFDETAKIIEEFKEIKGLQGFFTQVGKLMK